MSFCSKRLLLTASVAASVLYLLSSWWPTPALTIVCKGLAVSALGLIAWRERRLLLAAALFLSSLGDILLSLRAGLFVFGLGAFLLAHLVYTTLFVRRRISTYTTVRRPVLSIAVLAYAAALAAYLIPGLGAMLVPVLLYVAAIVAMVLTAAHSGYRSGWVVRGALLFLISDSILGISRFRQPLAFRSFLVWASYYVGQYCLARGVGSEPRVTASEPAIRAGSSVLPW